MKQMDLEYCLRVLWEDVKSVTLNACFMRSRPTSDTLFLGNFAVPAFLENPWRLKQGDGVRDLLASCRFFQIDTFTCFAFCQCIYRHATCLC
ncbi:hypothetical protein HHUSO_G8983 [Huso huso]|uniref:Uncharacterized protein n=1 Tax=Huso huso TaxID=61971 RepID=A0ABR0ZSP8_HUSHU